MFRGTTRKPKICFPLLGGLVWTLGGPKIWLQNEVHQSQSPIQGYPNINTDQTRPTRRKHLGHMSICVWRNPLTKTEACCFIEKAKPAAHGVPPSFRKLLCSEAQWIPWGKKNGTLFWRSKFKGIGTLTLKVKKKHHWATGSERGCLFLEHHFSFSRMAMFISCLVRPLQKEGDWGLC